MQFGSLFIIIMLFCYSIISHGEFITTLELTEGWHEYKFIVDEQWCHDPSKVSPYLRFCMTVSSLYITIWLAFSEIS